MTNVRQDFTKETGWFVRRYHLATKMDSLVSQK